MTERYCKKYIPDRLSDRFARAAKQFSTLNLCSFNGMLPKLLAKLVASEVTRFLNAFPFATDPKGTIGVIEKARPHIVCALLLGDRKGPGENVGDRCNSSHPRCTSGAHEIGEYPARECVGEGDSRISFVESL